MAAEVTMPRCGIFSMGQSLWYKGVKIVMKPKDADIEILTSRQMQRMSLHKSLALAFLLVFAAPGLVMHAAYMDITIKQYAIYLGYFSLSFPLLAGLFYWVLAYAYRCPKCKSFWSFRKVKEQLIQHLKEGDEFGECVKCSSCDYEQIHKSIRKRGKK
jgi:hypothetical protein